MWNNTTNPNNVMTYEAYEKDGSKLTVSNPSNPSSGLELCDALRWSVSDRSQGQEGAETAVEIINAKSIRIYNKRNGVLTQVVINTCRTTTTRSTTSTSAWTRTSEDHGHYPCDVHRAQQ